MPGVALISDHRTVDPDQPDLRGALVQVGEDSDNCQRPFSGQPQNRRSSFQIHLQVSAHAGPRTCTWEPAINFIIRGRTDRLC
jgi:hypothetical protein